MFTKRSMCLSWGDFVGFHWNYLRIKSEGNDVESISYRLSFLDLRIHFT